MIRPVDMQLAYWKVEQQASHTKSPDSSFAQTMQSQEMVEENQLRQQRVLQSEESQTEDRIKEKKEERDSRQFKGRGKKENSGAEEDDASEETLQASASPEDSSLKGLDLYG